MFKAPSNHRTGLIATPYPSSVLWGLGNCFGLGEFRGGRTRKRKKKRKVGRRIWHHGPRTSIFKSSCPAVWCVSQAVDSQVPDWVRVCVPPQCSHAASPTCHHARQLRSPGLTFVLLPFLHSYIVVFLHSYKRLLPSRNPFPPPYLWQCKENEGNLSFSLLFGVKWLSCCICCICHPL